MEKNKLTVAIFIFKQFLNVQFNIFSLNSFYYSVLFILNKLKKKLIFFLTSGSVETEEANGVDCLSWNRTEIKVHSD
jgi:hypothetical protein